MGKVKNCGSSPVIHVEDKIRLTVGRASYDQSVVVQSGRKPEINRKIHRCRNTAELGESGSCEKKSGFILARIHNFEKHAGYAEAIRKFSPEAEKIEQLLRFS